jgi:hypothetical protein
MADRILRPLKLLTFNANELSKQLQDIHIDIALFSETHLKPQSASQSWCQAPIWGLRSDF